MFAACLTLRLMVLFASSVLLPNAMLPMAIHEGMFVPFLEHQLTKEQRQTWMPRVENFEVIGTYAQTELGHGELGGALTADVL